MAEWAQLLHARSHDQLKRGWWYFVLDRPTHGGMVRVSLAPGMAVLHRSEVRLLDGEPQRATRLGPVTMPEKPPGAPVAMMRFTAICPRNHELGKVQIIDDRVNCPKCGHEYELEDEAKSPGDTPQPS